MITKVMNKIMKGVGYRYMLSKSRWSHSGRSCGIMSTTHQRRRTPSRFIFQSKRCGRTPCMALSISDPSNASWTSFLGHVNHQQLRGRTMAWKADASIGRISPQDFTASVQVMIDGDPEVSEKLLNSLIDSLREDGETIVREAASLAMQSGKKEIPMGELELSLVLCDDATIAELNQEWRGKNEPTDVLSFEILGDDFVPDDEDESPGMQMGSNEDDEGATDDDLGPSENSAPKSKCSKDYTPSTEQFTDDRGWEEEDEVSLSSLVLLGDVVISVDTAQRQAKERAHSLLEECRILLIHGVLHLLGYDHEHDETEAKEMETAEIRILESMGVRDGSGLIRSASSSQGSRSSNRDDSTEASHGAHITSEAVHRSASPFGQDVRLLALDMDGTLLDSGCRILPSSVDAIRAVLSRGVRVMLATGKARPAAQAALGSVGLAGNGLVVGPNHPGIFLQGLAVHCYRGTLIAGGVLDKEVVKQAFEFAQESNVACVGFSGERCVTLQMRDEVEALHARYYEPLADVMPSIDAIVKGPPMRKLLFMASSNFVDTTLKPYWESGLRDSSAQPMQAVSNMLEIVPRGWNKWVGMEALLKHENVSADAVMAIGDGMNDFDLVKNVGIGVAMANGVPAVRSVAKAVVASNDDGGVAEAIERYIL